MTLQNRVMPTGEIVAMPERGLLTGNRGIIHDPRTKTLLNRRWTGKAWIACVCEFRGRRRDVMGGRSWTELFFLDEATALAAGHRPCFFCRRDDANAFRAAWQNGNAVRHVSAPDMDEVLHRERLDGRAKRLHPLPMPIAELPDGTMVQVKTENLLIANGCALRWSFGGYGKAGVALSDALLLTPPSTVRALNAGYRPMLHPSAAQSAKSRADKI